MDREDQWRHKNEQILHGDAEDVAPGVVVGWRSKIIRIHPDAVFALVYFCDRQILQSGENFETGGTLAMVAGLKACR